MNVINEINIGQIIVSLLSVVTILVAIIGWFANQRLNRKNEIAKELRGYRLDMLKSIGCFIDIFVKNGEIFRANINTGFTEEVKEIFEKVRTKISLYGRKDEMDTFKEFCDAYNEHRFDEGKNENDTFQDLRNTLNKLCYNNLKNELKLEK